MKTANIILEYQPTIPTPPMTLGDMYRSACSADDVTMNAWRDKWLGNIMKNKESFGSFGENGVGTLFGKFEGLPCIVAGSGPSLSKNIGLLKDRPRSIKLISCLHNFHFMEDHGAEVDFYVSLDAGSVTISEVTEGGSSRGEQEYWELTKNRTLIAYIGSDPELLRRWKGKVLFYNAPTPDREFRERVNQIEPFNQWVSNGGNVLGACMYIAKGYLGSQTTIFIGADFSFSNENSLRFHAWDSKYDQSIGNTLRAVDIFGNSIKTWPSYYNFALWFCYVVYTLPGIYINATEGGIFGAFREGNVERLRQMDLSKVFEMYSIHEKLRWQAEHPSEYARESDIVLV